MSHALSTEAERLNQEHKELFDKLGGAEERYLQAGSRLTETSRALDEARFRHDQAQERYLRGGSSISRVRDLKYDRSDALSDHSRAETTYYDLRGLVDQLQRESVRNLEASTEHYTANADAYHQMAIEDARKAGIEIHFSGAVAQNVRVVSV